MRTPRRIKHDLLVLAPMRANHNVNLPERPATFDLAGGTVPTLARPEINLACELTALVCREGQLGDGAADHTEFSALDWLPRSTRAPPNNGTCK